MHSFQRYYTIILVVTLCLVTPSFAQETKPKTFKGVEVYSGWGQASLKTKQDYHYIPLIVDFDFDIKNLSQTLRSKYPGLLEFQIEPIFSLVLQPNHNIEIGNTFALKAGFLPETARFQPYVLAGFGGIFITQHTLEQCTQLNFSEHVGGGAHYFFNKNMGLNFQIRYRHISNADIKKPNKGITGCMTLFGVTQKF